ncbi:MAG: hypothetical protein QOG80_2142 [Pseudonocardiales bacterium]|nr:hypothetical protein [Pseudonocardiales bacterium]
MTARVLVACDLDSTLIYSRRTAGADVLDLVCVERRDGLPAAFVTSAAARLLADLTHQVDFVPVTTRTPAQLARVELPGVITYAIAANGGRILLDGAIDADWSAIVAARLADVAGFDAAREHAERFCAGLAGRPHEVDGLFCFAVLPTPEIPTETLAAEAEWAIGNGWRVSVQGRKVYWVPQGLTKSAAVAEVAHRCGADLVLAAGDSLLDADLFELADAGIRPAHGELAESGWSAPHVEVTSATGVAAGEQIVEWFASVADSAGRLTATATAAAATDQ